MLKADGTPREMSTTLCSGTIKQEMVGTFLPGQLRIPNEDSSLPGYCPDCGAAVIRTHFDPALASPYDEHWVDRCLSCGYGHEFRSKAGVPEDWFQHPHKQPSQSGPPTTIAGLLLGAVNRAKEENP